MTLDEDMTLIAFAKARLDEDEAQAAKLLEISREAIEMLKDPRFLGREVPGWHSWPDVEAMSSRALREVAAKWRIVRDFETSVWACRNVTGAELDGRGYASMCGGRDGLRAACAAVTFAWKDHPDYRQGWALGVI